MVLFCFDWYGWPRADWNEWPVYRHEKFLQSNLKKTSVFHQPVRPPGLRRFRQCLCPCTLRWEDLVLMEHDLNRWSFGQSVEGNHKRCLKEFWRLLIWTILRLRVATTKRWRLCWSQAHLLRWGFGFWGVFLDGSVLQQCEILGKAGLWWFVICFPQNRSGGGAILVLKRTKYIQAEHNHLRMPKS